MKTGLFILIAGILCVLINDSLLYLQIKRYFKRKIYSYLFWFQSLFFVACIVGYHLFIPTLKGPEAYFWVEKAISVILLFYTPKTLYIIVNAFSLLLRKMKCIPAAKVISRLALGIALLAFIMILNGITWYRYSYKIERETVCIKRLPDNFNNFRIIQLTDLHLGSYGEHYPGITKLVNEVNRLKPDLIVFTGDMVNSFASEITPWIESLRELKAKYGKYAITGNHDYGTYVKWPTREDQENNLKHFFKNMELTGFKMLNNTNIPPTFPLLWPTITSVRRNGETSRDSSLSRSLPLATRSIELPGRPHVGRTHACHAIGDHDRKFSLEPGEIRLPGI